MLDFEQLGAFYLGKRYDLDSRQLQEQLLLYDSKDLTTHAVCVGMTGSGKTGLCLALLEEAAIDGIPAIAIDPKGDLGNLLLTFPELRAEDFQPWIDAGAAARAGETPEEFAAKTAATWRKGLTAWGQDASRIERFRSSADVAIYTPGSTAGLPLTVLRTFDAPPAAIREDTDLLRDRITSAVSGLLGLLGIAADPVRSREHILLANLLEHHWRAGQNLDVASLIREIQSPPFAMVGVMDVETFYPSKARADLALSLNNLLASPSFAGWMEGEPLDIQRLLYTSEGKPRLSIISIAHLSDAQRMFFVTLLLNEVVAWVRSQPGTSSLRALLYMDEIFGYFPPVANPPSKLPMLSLLKQARAYGLGVVLATQNPVDLDYKGLANTGTWFIGRLQTERDKARVLEGLEGASAEAGAKFQRAQMEQMLSALGQRVFLMNNVHEEVPVVFQTRWVLSYLRGPLTRDQIRELMAARKQDSHLAAGRRIQPATPSSSTGALPSALPSERPSRVELILPEDLFDAATTTTSTKATAEPAATSVTGPSPGKALSADRWVGRPLLPPEANEKFIVGTQSHGVPPGSVYIPALLAKFRLHFVRATYAVDEWQECALLQELASGEVPTPPWHGAQRIVAETLAFTSTPVANAAYASLPTELLRRQTYASLGSQLKDHLYQSQTLTLWRSPELRETSRPGESESEFRIRIAQLAREKRDAAKDRLRSRYATRFTTLDNRIRTAEDRVAREKGQLQQASLDTTASLGESIFGTIFGRKVFTRTNASKVTRTMRGLGKARQQKADVAQAEAALAELRQQRTQLDEELQHALTAIAHDYHPEQIALEQVTLRPRKSDINVIEICLVWLPSGVRLAAADTP